MSKATHKRISVVIPTHNRRPLVMLAIDSALRQHREPLEVIVVADGCTDDTVESIRALGDERVQLLDLPKAPGHGWENRNEALRRARGDVIAYLSDDDLWLPDHLSRVGELFDADVADVVQANVCIVHPDGRLEMTGLDWRVPEYRRRFIGGIEHRTPSSAISHVRGVAERAGGWRTVESHGDRDLWVRMLQSDASTVALMEPTALFFQAWRGVLEEREQQAHEYAELIRDPIRLARLKAEMSRVALRFEADTRHELYERNDQHAALHERHGELHERYATDVEALRAELRERDEQNAALRVRLDAIAAERDRLLEREAALRGIEQSRWWRMGQRLEPLRRVARAVRPAGAGRQDG
jgi:glycosyltransferase involved in cell wall biosynthesis